MPEKLYLFPFSLPSSLSFDFPVASQVLSTVYSSLAQRGSSVSPSSSLMLRLLKYAGEASLDCLQVWSEAHLLSWVRFFRHNRRLQFLSAFLDILPLHCIPSRGNIWKSQLSYSEADSLGESRQHPSMPLSLGGKPTILCSVEPGWGFGNLLFPPSHNHLGSAPRGRLMEMEAAGGGDFLQPPSPSL